MENEKTELAVELLNVYKSYSKEKIFSNLNMSFIKNKITIIFGPSGCGKTTLLNIIAGMENIDSGNVVVRADTLSYVSQQDTLIPWLNIYKNIEFVLKSYINKNNADKIIMKYLELVKLKDHKDKFPYELSGGMKRRVSIARAFAYNSNLLLMDEPFVGLDYELKKEIINEFLKIWNNDKKTVILVTHDKEEANILGDLIYYLT